MHTHTHTHLAVGIAAGAGLLHHDMLYTAPSCVITDFFFLTEWKRTFPITTVSFFSFFLSCTKMDEKMKDPVEEAVRRSASEKVPLNLL